MKNEKINILVTGIGGDIGIGITKILNEIKYHKILVGCDINKYPANMIDVDFFHYAPSARNKEKYLSFINDIICRHDIDLIIPSSEIEIKTLDENRLILGDKVKVLINDNKIINIFMDKLKTIEFFASNGIEHPETYDIMKFTDQLTYPYLLKDKFTQGSKGVVKIEDIDDFKYYKKKYPNSIIQEIVGVDSEEYTIGVFSDGNSVYNIAFQRELGYGSLSKFVKRVSDPKIDKLAKTIANIVNLRGSINIQARKNSKGEYIPFEINPRLSSTLAFRHYFGFKDLKWWIDLMYGSKMEQKPKYFNGIGIKTVNEVYFEMEDDSMKIVETIINEYGFRELKEKPTEAELSKYYKNVYYQQANGSYQKEYSVEEVNYINSKLEQKYLLCIEALECRSKGEGLAFLDIGCGEGWSLAFFKKKGFKVNGVEYSDYACKTFNNEVTEDIEVGNPYIALEKMINKDTRFDIILIQNVLEHVLEPLKLLRLTQSLLTEQGFVIIQVPNDFSCLQEYLEEQKWIDRKFWITYPDHISYFNKDGLRALCGEAGLNMEKILGDYPIDFNLLNPDTNYVMDKTKGKNCHLARVFVENMMHQISPERTNYIYEQLGEMGLGREIIGIFSKIKY